MRPGSAFAATPIVPVPAGAACPRHSGATAIAACRRCGTFVCVDDRVTLDGLDFCHECAARPDVDYLEAFRQKHWGKRDGWAWLFGLSAVVNVPIGLTVLATSLTTEQSAADVALGIAILVWAGVAGAFWAGVKAARRGLLLALLLFAAVSVARSGLVGLGGIVLPLLVVVSALSSVHTKLFFKLDVPREQLRKAWAPRHDNVLARQALVSGIAGVLFPPFALLALISGLIGLRRVDPNAFPPVGRKGQAIAGTVLGAVGTLAWGSLLVMALRGP